jgi:biopolymer transport protein ExbB/TolQ
LGALLAVVATWLFFWIGDGWSDASWWASFWKILNSCGWVGVVEVALFFWGLFLAMLKVIFWLQQRRYLRWQVLPANITNGTKIAVSNVDECLGHVESLTSRPRRSILLNRVCVALEHLHLTGNSRDIRGTLAGQSAIDANLLDSSYAVLRFLVWVIPIVGFIGTVIGIGLAVNEFASFIPEVAAPEEAMKELRQGLGHVTSGLGTAFNTTLIALCLAAPLMLITSSLRKSEERLLAEIDHFSNHYLLGTLGGKEE